MNTFLWLYEAIKAKLPKTYTDVFYQTMIEDKEGCVGVYFYESSNDVEDIDGSEVYNSIKVHIQVNSERSMEGLQKALNYLEQFTYNIETQNSNIEQVTFIAAQHVGPRAVAIGRNQFDILVCKCDVDLKYIVNVKNN